MGEKSRCGGRLGSNTNLRGRYLRRFWPVAADFGRRIVAQGPAKAEGQQRERRSAGESNREVGGAERALATPGERQLEQHRHETRRRSRGSIVAPCRQCWSPCSFAGDARRHRSWPACGELEPPEGAGDKQQHEDEEHGHRRGEECAHANGCGADDVDPGRSEKIARP
jgi:hypothetical protein